MQSRITIEVDFQNGNQPIIQVVGKNSITGQSDVRDNLVQTFLQGFGPHSYAKINFKLADRDSGELSFHSVATIAPIKPEDLGIEWQKMKEQHDYYMGINQKPIDTDAEKEELQEKISLAVLNFLSDSFRDGTISNTVFRKLQTRYIDK